MRVTYDKILAMTVEPKCKPCFIANYTIKLRWNIFLTLKEAGSVKMIPKRLRYLLDFGYMNILQDFKILIWSNYEHKVYFFFKSDKIRVSAWTICKVINQLIHLILSYQLIKRTPTQHQQLPCNHSHTRSMLVDAMCVSFVCSTCSTVFHKKQTS